MGIAPTDLIAHFGTSSQPLCIYGDPACPLWVHLQSVFVGANLALQEAKFNTEMSEVRFPVGRIFGGRTFGDILNYCKFLVFKKNLKIGLGLVGNICIIYAWLNIVRNCLYGSETSHYFSLEPPLSEEYFQ